mmetsp:Transcript_31667/g.35455  ORF Transcript_31667/g.35455 Transcript_31667/m.35455 type:complete len:259 (+) Transcript_31667:2464-3240(+)
MPVWTRRSFESSPGTSPRDKLITNCARRQGTHPVSPSMIVRHRPHLLTIISSSSSSSVTNPYSSIRRFRPRRGTFNLVDCMAVVFVEVIVVLAAPAAEVVAVAAMLLEMGSKSLIPISISPSEVSYSPAGLGGSGIFILIASSTKRTISSARSLGNVRESQGYWGSFFASTAAGMSLEVKVSTSVLLVLFFAAATAAAATAAASAAFFLFTELAFAAFGTFEAVVLVVVVPFLCSLFFSPLLDVVVVVPFLLVPFLFL